jgi:phosphate transport system protein
MTMVDPIEGHTIKRYDGELNQLHHLLLEMGERVLAQLREALAAFNERDLRKAQQVVASDHLIDQMEVQADDEVVKLLARRAPLGGDLRLVIAVSKGISDLERIGDEAVRIAGLVIHLFGQEGSDPGRQLLRDVNRMADIALRALQDSLKVCEDWDEKKARQVIDDYRELDEEFQSDLRRLMTYVMEDARNVGYAITVVLVIKSLERIGHHAQSLAEYVVFQVKGENVRADGGPASGPPAEPGS